MITFGDAFPAFEAEDEITFKDGKIIPNLKSNLKNFFIGEATYTEAGTWTLKPKSVISPSLFVKYQSFRLFSKAQGMLAFGS